MAKERSNSTLRCALFTLLLGILFTASGCAPARPDIVRAQLVVAPALLSVVGVSTSADAPAPAVAAVSVDENVAVRTPAVEAAATNTVDAASAVTSTTAVTLPSIIASGAQISAPITATIATAITTTIPVTTEAVISTVAISETEVTTPSILAAIQPITTTAAISATRAPTVATEITEEITDTEPLTPTVGVSATDTLRATTVVSEPITVRQRIALITTDRLNVRSEPNAESTIIAKLLRGDRVELTAASNAGDWYEVRLIDDQGLGWISAAFADVVEEEIALEDASPALAAAAAEVSAPVLFEVLIIGDRLNVRAEPGLGGAVVAKLLQGNQVPVIGSTADASWYEVLLDDGTAAWIAAEYASQVEQVETEAETPASADTDEADTDEADTDEADTDEADTDEADTDEADTDEADTDEADTDEADTDEADTGTADNDRAEGSGSEADEVTAAPVGGEDAATGEDVAEATASQEAVTTETGQPTAITQPDAMNVRGGPSTTFPVVTNVPAGTALAIVARNGAGDWYQVALPDQDEAGWVYAPLVTTQGAMDSVDVLADDALPEAPESSAGAPVQAATAVNAPPPVGGGSFGYGVQAHVLGGGVDDAMNATAGMGFNWMKQQVEWRVFEGTQGNVDFSELRRVADAAGGRGINMLFSVVNAPDWAREPGFDASVGGPPADPQTFAAFVGRLAGEFCGSSVKAIEVWNEQNLHYEWGNKPLNPADYMNLLRPAYGSIKAACPSMLVISGAPTPAGDAGPYARDDFAYLEGMYQNGLAGYADGIGAHPSGYNVPPSVGWQEACTAIQQTGNFFNGPCDTPHHSWSFRSTMEGYRNIMNVYGDSGKRIWPTEFGWAAGGMFDPRYAYAEDNSFEEQAAWTVEAYQMMRNWGWVGPAFLWNLNFRVVADGSEKAQWGIVRNDYSPLPVYSALQAMPK